MDREKFVQASVRIRNLEKKLLTKIQFERLYEAENLEEAVRHLNETAYSEDLAKIDRTENFEKALSKIQKNSFIYCDPPYIGRHVDYYDSWDENLEKLLYEKLLNSGVKFMLSTWHSNKYRKNEYIDKIWKFCNIIKKEHFYFIGAKEQNRNSITEALLVNYNTQLKINKIKSEEKNNLRNYSFFYNKFWLECVYFEGKCSGNTFKKRSEAKRN